MIEAQELHKLLINNQVIPIKFVSHRLILDSNGVLYWPKHDLIIFSDLHLEKGSFLSQFANPLPRFDSSETIKRMLYVCELYRPQSVICLGDSFHDGNALNRMEETDLHKLNQLIVDIPNWHWVLGNHDPDIPQVVKGERSKTVHINNLLFVHEPENIQALESIDGQIIGHYHPKSSYKIANRKVSGKSFVCADSILLMPAFGKYTGGLDIKDSAFDHLYDKKHSQVYMIFNRRIYML